MNGQSTTSPPLPPPLPPPYKIQPSNYNLTYFNRTFTIMQSNDSITNAMWNSGHILLKYLEKPTNDIFQKITSVVAREDNKDMQNVSAKDAINNAVILELGAGVAHVGIGLTIGLQPKEYIFTDYQIGEINTNVIHNLVQNNIDKDQYENKNMNEETTVFYNKTKIKVLNVDWKKEPATCYNGCSIPNIVLCIDCVWITELYKPLINHILYLSSLNPNLIIVLAHEHRLKNSFKDFFNILIENDFLIHKIYDEELTVKSPIVGLFLINKRI